MAPVFNWRQPEPFSPMGPGHHALEMSVKRCSPAALWELVVPAPTMLRHTCLPACLQPEPCVDMSGEQSQAPVLPILFFPSLLTRREHLSCSPCSAHGTRSHDSRLIKQRCLQNVPLLLSLQRSILNYTSIFTLSASGCQGNRNSSFFYPRGIVKSMFVCVFH